jgi:hypothetical protein
MTDNSFDHFVRNTLHDHTAPVPAGLWEKVNPAQDEKDRKGFFLPRKYRNGLLLGLLLLAGSAGGYWLLEGSPNSNNSSQTDSIAQEGSAKNMTPTTNVKAFEQASTLADQNNTQQQNQEAEKQNDIATSGTTATQPSPVANQRTTNNAAQAAASMNAVSKQINPLEKSLLSHQSNTAKGNHGSPLITRPSATANASVHEQQTATIVTDEEDKAELPFDLGTKMESGQFIFNRLQYQPLDQLRERKINSLYTNKIKNMIICPPYSRGNTDWFAEVYVSPDIAFKSVKNVSASQQYMQKKDSSESMQIGYSAGVRIVKPITDNFLLRAGLQYSQVNEKFSYRSENEVRTTTVISVRTIVRSPGDTLRITDTSTVQQTGYKNNTIRNRYRSFDIPVTVGYQFGNDNLKIGLNAGVIFNISSWYQGVVLDSSLAAIPVSKGNTGIYKNSFGLGLYGGISILKPLGENTQLFFEPYFRYNLKSITNNTAPYQQRFSIGGLSIGLRYNLNR